MVTDNSRRTEFLLKALHLPASNTRMAELYFVRTITLYIEQLVVVDTTNFSNRIRFSAGTIRQQAGDAFQVEIVDYH